MPSVSFLLSEGDREDFRVLRPFYRDFLHHDTPIVPPRVRDTTGRITLTFGDGSDTAQTGYLPAGAQVGDLAVVVMGGLGPVAVGSGWTTALSVDSPSSGADVYGFGVVAWRILTGGDVASGEFAYTVGGAGDLALEQASASYACVAIEAGTYNSDAPIADVAYDRWSSDSAYADGAIVAPWTAFAPDGLGLVVLAYQGESTGTAATLDTGAVTSTPIYDSEADFGVAAVQVAEVSPGDAALEAVWTVTGPSSSLFAADVLVAPNAVALGGLSNGERIGFSVSQVRGLDIVADTVQLVTEVDPSGEPVDPLAGSRAVRFGYLPEDDGTLVVAGESPGATVLDDDDLAPVTLWVLDSGGATVVTGTGSVTASVTGGDAYTVVAAPFDTSAGLRVTASGPRHAGATPASWESSAAPSLPALSPYTASPMLMRRSPTVPAPTLVDGRPVDWQPTGWTEAPWGTFRVIVDGQDVTRFRGVPCQIDDFTLMEPFGCGPANITFPQIGPWEALTGDLAWLRIGADVDIVRLHPDGETTTVLWSGLIPKRGIQAGPGGRSRKLACIGDIWAGDLQPHMPRPYLPATDVGVLIADALNREVISRRIRKVARVTTGIEANKRGTSDQTVLGYVQELLGIYGTVEDGSTTWTVGRVAGQPRKYEIRQKDLGASPVCSVRSGALWDLALDEDQTETPNVIYGSGVNPDGYSWAGWVYPRGGDDTYVAYPMRTSPLEVIDVGTRDVDTLTGTGVTDLQERLNSLGIRGVSVTVDGVYNSSDAADVRVVQDHYGLLVDGIVGPQTWSACFPQYRTNTLDGCFRLPLTAARAVVPRLYNADGTDAGANPDYDPDVLRVAVDRQYEAGITKSQARRSAKAERLRALTPGMVGTITLSVDPPEMSRWDITEGTSIRVRDLNGGSPVLHVVGVQVRPPTSSTDPGSVTLTVDEHARDLLTVAAIIARDRESKDDPVRMPARKHRRSKMAQDSIQPFDGESAGGVVHPLALIGGLWVYQDIPISQAGRVARVSLTTSPATKFTVAFFGDVTVTPEQMVRVVGSNPLAESKSGYGPYDRLVEDHPELGFIQAVGGPGQAAGYDPGYEDSPYTPGKSTPLTGKLRSNASWEYTSTRPPWVRVFFWAPSSCTISGRIVPAPLDA